MVKKEKQENPSAIAAVGEGSKELLEKYAAFYTKKGYGKGYLVGLKRGIQMGSTLLVGAVAVGAIAGIAVGCTLGRLLFKKAPEQTTAPQTEEAPTEEAPAEETAE